MSVVGGRAEVAIASPDFRSSDPNVWSGRASQEDFVELAVSGLASMYPASDWSCFAPGHHGYQRACDLISGQASIGPFGSPVFACAGKTEPPSRLILSQTSAGKGYRSGYIIACSSSHVSVLNDQTGWAVGDRSSPRSSDREPERSRRCGPACWRAQSPARCGAAASWPPRSRA